MMLGVQHKAQRRIAAEIESSFAPRKNATFAERKVTNAGSASSPILGSRGRSVRGLFSPAQGCFPDGLLAFGDGLGSLRLARHFV